MTRARSPTFRVPLRRRREGKTDFVNRLALIKSGKPRMVVRRSNRNIMVQFIEFDPKGDRTILTVSGKHLAKQHQWPSRSNVWTAYLAGLMAGKAAKASGLSSFVADFGRYTASKGSLVFAALQGAADAGLETSFDAGKVPQDKLANPPDKYKELFDKIKSTLAG